MRPMWIEGREIVETNELEDWESVPISTQQLALTNYSLKS